MNQSEIAAIIVPFWHAQALTTYDIGYIAGLYGYPVFLYNLSPTNWLEQEIGHMDGEGDSILIYQTYIPYLDSIISKLQAKY